MKAFDWQHYAADRCHNDCDWRKVCRRIEMWKYKHSTLNLKGFYPTTLALLSYVIQPIGSSDSNRLTSLYLKDLFWDLTQGTCCPKTFLSPLQLQPCMMSPMPHMAIGVILQNLDLIRLDSLFQSSQNICDVS